MFYSAPGDPSSFLSNYPGLDWLSSHPKPHTPRLGQSLLFLKRFQACVRHSKATAVKGVRTESWKWPTDISSGEFGK